MNLLAAQRVLWLACLVAQVLLIGAIFQRGIAKQYRFFLAYLIVEAAAGVVLVQIPYRTPAYAYAYRYYEAAIVLFRAGAVAELFERVCAHFPVVRRIRFALATFVVLLTGIVSITLARPAGDLWKYPQTFAIYIRQFETTVLAVSLVLMWWFLTQFMSLTPSVGGNVAVHWKLLTIYFGISGFAALPIPLWRQGRGPYGSVAVLMVDLVCFVAWIRGFNRFGENPPPSVLSKEEAARRRTVRQAILQSVKHAGGQDFERL